MERKTLRNILHDVLSTPGDDDLPGLDELSGLIHRQVPDDDGIFVLEGETEGDCIPAPHGGCRKPATHYLSETTLDDLGAARAKLAAMLAPNLGENPSKSDIVDQALQIVLDEFAAKGMDSTLVQKIMIIAGKKDSSEGSGRP